MRVGKKVLSILLSIVLLASYLPSNPYRIHAEEDDTVVSEYTETAEVVEAAEEKTLEEAVDFYAEEEEETLEEVPVETVEEVVEQEEIPVVSETVETEDADDETDDENVKFRMNVSSKLTDNTTTTVTGEVYDDYSAKLVLPNKDVNAENVTVEMMMQNIGSLNVNERRESRNTIHTGLTGQRNLYQALSMVATMTETPEALFAFKDATLNVTARVGSDKETVVYQLTGSTFTGTQDAKTINATTDTEDARKAWHLLVNSNNLTAATKTDEDSYFLIKNGSTIQIGKELLSFETTDDLKLDNFDDLDALEAEIRRNLTVSDTDDSAVVFFLKKNSTLAVGNSYITSKEDVTVTIDVDATDMKVLSTLKETTDTKTLVMGAIAIMNQVLALVDAKDSVDITIDIGEIPEEEETIEDDVKFRLKVSSVASDNTVGSVTGTVYNDYNADVIVNNNLVNTSNVTFDVWMQNVQSLGVDSLRHYQRTLHPENPGQDHTLNAIAAMLSPLAGKDTKVVAHIDDLSTTYSITYDGAKAEAKTTTADASAVWHAIVNEENMAHGTKNDDDSYFLIKNGSYIRVADKKLEFETDQDLKLDDLGNLDTLPDDIKKAVKLTEGLEVVDGIEFYLEPETELKVGQSYVTLLQDALVTTDLSGTNFAASLKNLQAATTVGDYIVGLMGALQTTIADLAGNTTNVYFEFGHKWGEPEWSWNEDHSEATATFTCDNNEKHTKTVKTTEITAEENPATYVDNGSITYTATVTGPDGKTYTGTDTVETEPIDYKFIMEVSSKDSTGNTGAVTAIVDPQYVAKLIIDEGNVNTSNVAFNFWMKNVASLGVSDPRHYEKAVKLADSGADVSLDKVVALFSVLQKATVIGKVDDKSTTYSIVNEGRVLTATPDEHVAEVWHALVNEENVTYGTREEDSSATFKKGSFIQIADRLLKFDKDFTLDNLTDPNVTVQEIRDAVSLSIVDEKADKIILYLEPESELAMGSSFVKLNEDRDLLVTVDVTDFDETNLSRKLDELRDARQLLDMIRIVFNASQTVMRAMNNNTTTVTFELGHKFNAEDIKWDWADDYSSATAVIPCENNEEHTIELEAEISKVEEKPTCTEAGKNTYTATVEYEGETYTDVQVEEVEATDHKWGEPTYEWTETADGYTVKAKVVCENDETHTQEEEVTATSKVTKDPTCEGTGTMTYTATFENELFETQTKEVDIDPIGHDWDAPTWEWTETADGYTATATFVCKNDNSHTKTETADVTYEEEGNTGTYTATVVGPDGKTYTDTQEVELAAKILRIKGVDRFETSIKVAKYLKEEVLKVDKYSTIVLSTGLNYADALSGSYLANVNEAPMLLIGKDTQNVIDFVKENLASDGTIYILGKQGAVPDEWLEGLESFNQIRLGGATRFETNLEILNELDFSGGKIMVCTGWNFADSLSASALDMPVLLVEKKLSDAQKEFLSGLNGGRVDFYIAGGTNAVGDAVVEELSAYGSIVKRYAGEDRYETSILMAEDNFIDPKGVLLAYGYEFADGLSGGVLAAKLGYPLVLSDSIVADAEKAADYVEDEHIRNGIVLGGTARITDDIVRMIFDMAEDDVIEIY